MNPSPLYAIAPGLLFTFLFFAGMPFYALRRRQDDFVPHPDLARRKPSFVATTFMIGYLGWIIDPLERALSTGRVSPNMISYTSLACCAAAGVLAGTGYLATAAWIYVLAGVLDVLDGRVARRTGKTSPAGALLDSVLDRWGEFFMLAGLAFTLHTTLGMLAVLTCIAGSQMVSYTRARSEALGVRGDGGSMQRAERMVGVILALLIGAVGRATELYDAEAVIAMMLFAIGIASAFTSIGRLIDGMRSLRQAEASRLEELTPPPAQMPTPPPAHATASRLGTLQPRE
jgi:CDP-diacylglycerol--glycerol-3-phosphate 3-phosphatidyltransferase